MSSESVAAGRAVVLGVPAEAARVLAARGLAALPDVLAQVAEALGCDDVSLRGPDCGIVADPLHRHIPAQPTGRPAALELPVRRTGQLLAVLTVSGAHPLTEADAAVLEAVASVVALALAAGRAAATRQAARAILDEEADRAQVAAGLYEGLGDALVSIRYAAELVATGRAEPAALDEPARVALTALRHAHRDLRAHALEDGVRAALDDLPNRWAGDRLHDGMPELRLSVTAPDEALDALPPAVAVTIQRVAEAALRGAVGWATVRATILGSRVKLWVESAEIAYDASELNRWTHRASALGGELVLRPDGVELDLPVALEPLHEGRHDDGSDL